MHMPCMCICRYHEICTCSIARGDISTLTEERFAFFMRPAKNVRHRRSKTVPMVIGGGGEYVNACAEVQRMLALDPTPVGQEATTPMFRKSDCTAFTTDVDIRNIVRQLCIAIGEDPLHCGGVSEARRPCSPPVRTRCTSAQCAGGPQTATCIA